MIMDKEKPKIFLCLVDWNFLIKVEFLTQIYIYFFFRKTINSEIIIANKNCLASVNGFYNNNFKVKSHTKPNAVFPYKKYLINY